MALIAMCAYCTEENDKLKYLKQTLDSLVKTVDFSKHRLIIINNGSELSTGTGFYLVRFCLTMAYVNIKVLTVGDNLGTAEGINIALRERKEGEYCVKCDDDWTTEQVGWIDEMIGEIEENPQIGILGLRRDDVYGELIEDGNLLWNSDIMGTCTMYNPLMLEKVGRLVQFSNYGFDDNIFSVRSEVAGFKNAYMKNIKITNLDEGGTNYTEWKKKEAGIYINEAGMLMEMIRSGKVNYYYPFE